MRYPELLHRDQCIKPTCTLTYFKLFKSLLQLLIGRGDVQEVSGGNSGKLDVPEDVDLVVECGVDQAGRVDTIGAVQT